MRRRLVELLPGVLAVKSSLHHKSPGLDHLGEPGALVFFIVGDQHANRGGGGGNWHLLQLYRFLLRPPTTANRIAVAREMPSETGRITGRNSMRSWCAPAGTTTPRNAISTEWMATGCSSIHAFHP